MPQDQPLNHTLPNDFVYCFSPSYELDGPTQQIRIVIDGMTGYIPTALVALNIDNAERLCDRFNRRLGLDRDGWYAIVTQSMRTPATGPNSYMH